MIGLLCRDYIQTIDFCVKSPVCFCLCQWYISRVLIFICWKKWIFIVKSISLFPDISFLFYPFFVLFWFSFFTPYACIKINEIIASKYSGPAKVFWVDHTRHSTFENIRTENRFTFFTPNTNTLTTLFLTINLLPVSHINISLAWILFAFHIIICIWHYVNYIMCSWRKI